MSAWTDYRIEEEIAREWAAHGETYQYIWVRTLCRTILHDTEAQVMSSKLPLDFPDSIGYWAFRGQRRVNYGQEPITRIYEVLEYTACLDEKDAPYPAVIFAGYNLRVWHGKYYPQPPEGIGGLQFVGGWWRVSWPWELQMPRNVHTTLAALVREVMDAEGRTPALEAARAWLKEAVK